MVGQDSIVLTSRPADGWIKISDVADAIPLRDAQYTSFMSVLHKAEHDTQGAVVYIPRSRVRAISRMLQRDLVVPEESSSSEDDEGDESNVQSFDDDSVPEVEPQNSVPSGPLLSQYAAKKRKLSWSGAPEESRVSTSPLMGAVPAKPLKTPAQMQPSQKLFKSAASKLELTQNREAPIQSAPPVAIPKKAVAEADGRTVWSQSHAHRQMEFERSLSKHSKVSGWVDYLRWASDAGLEDQEKASICERALKSHPQSVALHQQLAKVAPTAKMVLVLRHAAKEYPQNNELFEFGIQYAREIKAARSSLDLMEYFLQQKVEIDASYLGDLIDVQLNANKLGPAKASLQSYLAHHPCDANRCNQLFSIMLKGVDSFDLPHVARVGLESLFLASESSKPSDSRASFLEAVVNWYQQAKVGAEFSPQDLAPLAATLDQLSHVQLSDREMETTTRITTLGPQLPQEQEQPEAEPKFNPQTVSHPVLQESNPPVAGETHKHKSSTASDLPFPPRDLESASAEILSSRGGAHKLALYFGRIAIDYINSIMDATKLAANRELQKKIVKVFEFSLATPPHDINNSLAWADYQAVVLLYAQCLTAFGDQKSSSQLLLWAVQSVNSIGSADVSAKCWDQYFETMANGDPCSRDEAFAKLFRATPEYGMARSFLKYVYISGHKCRESFELVLDAFPDDVDLWILYLKYLKQEKDYAACHDVLKLAISTVRGPCRDRLWHCLYKFTASQKAQPMLEDVLTGYLQEFTTPSVFKLAEKHVGEV